MLRIRLPVMNASARFMNAVWQSEFRERMRRFGGSPAENSMPVSIKVRITSGCFHREHSPYAYRLIDDFVARTEATTPRCQIEEHESGPEIPVYLAVTTAGLTFAKSVVDLVTAIIKARSEGVKNGDRQTEPLELIVRGHSKDGEYFEEKILRIPNDQVITEKVIADALEQGAKTKKKSAKKAVAGKKPAKKR